jgi:hypothetical protein
VRGGLERLEEDVDAAVVAGQDRPPGNLGAGNQSGDSRRRGAQRTSTRMQASRISGVDS